MIDRLVLTLFCFFPCWISAAEIQHQPNSSPISCHGERVPALAIWRQLAANQHKRLVWVGPDITIQCHFDHWLDPQVINYLLQHYPFQLQKKPSFWLLEAKACPIVYFTAQHRPINLLYEWLKAFNQAHQNQKTLMWIDQHTNRLYWQGCQVDEWMNQLADWDLPQPQIAIEARIIASEISKGDYLRMRLGWKWADGQQHLAWSTSKDNSAELSGVLLPKGLALDLELGYLQETADVHILARPQLVTSVGHPAEIAQGEEIPYQSASESGATQVSFKKAVLALAVTPWLRGDHLVHLQLQIKKDAPLGDHSKEPIIQTNRLTSEVDVPDGRTLAVGGVFTQQQARSSRRIPIFADIPILGILFREHHHEEGQREMIIFITPHVLHGAEIK